MDNIHRLKKISETYEMYGLLREELSIEIEKAASQSGNEAKIADLLKFPNFVTAYNTVISKDSKDEGICHFSSVTCDTTAKYRTYDGTCNNLDNPLWGSAFTAQQRLNPPVYADGIREARNTSSLNTKLTSPRVISNEVMHSDKANQVESDYTVMFMAWGQFLDHDMVLTPTSKDSEDLNCCLRKKEQTANPVPRIECLPIELPAGDKRFKNKKCMNFKRSASGPLLGTSCTPEPRQQINQITSFIDASNVYGSSEEEVETLRDESQREFLKIEGSDFPPSGDENSCRRSDKKFHCLKAGDARANVILNLQFLHTLFLREHNRIAAMLTDLNKRWDGDRTFQETRKIIGAMLQHITYTEYLPKVLGSKLADEKGFIASKADFYDKSLNPSISNEFAVAAFRFGHSQINDHLRYYDSFFEPGRREALLRNQFDDVSMLQNNEGRRVPEVARWMVTEKSREVDRFFEEEVRDWTFKEFDLVALNIQRGRDHGIPPYSKWRLYCGLSELTDWNSLKTDHDPETIEKLKEVYGNPEDIDLSVGGVSEKHISGASVGPTFACILQEQFIRLKYGDRFWYDRNDEWDPVVGFSKEQIASIRNVTLAAVICNNVNTGEIQKDVFKTG
ncbi:hypothetical protein KUTeg_008210 [Tegillarca granosa]|uniref:Peroxidase n=1 Tax=Tegillarca granosa TaxID=220873 RepID=A0ABQ9F8J0_TEGGR|nr:hypothetical protein KUTeg_008210 [Tegillarca granosa]